jgi:hypothetical protein
MKKLYALLGAGMALALSASGASAQGQQYPMVDKVAAKIVQKYQTTSCADLAKDHQQPPSAQKAQMEQKAAQLLQNDAQIRAAFVAKVAAPVVNKMIVCGFIP